MQKIIDIVFQILFTILILTIGVMSVVSICGCGHNIYLERETTGFRLDIPVGDGTVGLAVGSDKTVRATVRGGASFETSSSNGGGLFSGSGGQSKITQFKSHAQLNEGNLAEVFLSSNVSDSVKLILASNLAAGVNAPYFPGSILQTKESTIHIGRAAIQSNSVEQIQSKESQGLNKLIDKTASVIGTNVANQAISTTGSVVHDVTNPLEGTVSEIKDTVNAVGDTVSLTSKEIREIILTLVLVILCAVLVVCLIAIFKSKRDNKKHKNVTVTTSDDNIWTTCATAAVFPELPDYTPKKSNQDIGWFNKFKKSVVNVVMLICRGFALIPPGVRKQILDFLVEYWKDLRAKKKAEKESRKNKEK